MWTTPLHGKSSQTTLSLVYHQSFPSVLIGLLTTCNMKINRSKTKELRVWFAFQSPSYAPIIIGDRVIDTVSEAKLLGVAISSDLKWNCHIDYVYKKAAKRLYGLRLLKRNALHADVLLSVYCTYIQPVKYSCESWHFNLPLYLSDQIENVQKRALRIIFPAMKYIDAMSRAKLTTLHERRSVLCNRFFFSNMISSSHKLNTLVPPKKLFTYNLRAPMPLY